jgi:actin-like ATPase involved in cell morphogenesis
MSYWLGIDVGTTFIAAAICRQQPDYRAYLEVVPLGTRSDAVRSVMYLGPGDNDGEVVVGEAAERRAAAEPDRVVREFLRGIGDDVPIVIDGVPHSASKLTASVVRWVVDRVAQRQGGPAHGITVTHPASWTAGTIRAMADALSKAGLPQVVFCTGAQAAATAYSIRERVDNGATIAVYDLGGGTFEAAVVRKTGATFALLGVPEGIDYLGGTDFDDAVFGHVLAAVPALSEGEPDATERLRRSFALCRRECTEAKEALSVNTEVTIPVLLPQIQSQVSLTRAEFEDLIRPQITETVDALRGTLASAGVVSADLNAVLLVGGSSRIPLVAETLTAEFGCPVAVDADPQAAIALGAALSGLPAGSPNIDGAAIDKATTGAAVPTPVGGSGFAGSGVHEPAQTEAHEPPWLAATALDVTGLDATALDVDAPDPQWRPASSGRFARLAAAGLFGLVLAGGAVSAPFIMTAHRGSDPAAAVLPAPKAPVATVAPAVKPPTLGVPDAQPQGPQLPETPVATAAAVPAPNAGGGDDRSPLNGNPTSADSATPAAPTKPLTSTARPKTAVPAPRNGANRSKAPAAPAPPPPESQHLPDWVQQARS